MASEQLYEALKTDDNESLEDYIQNNKLNVNTHFISENLHFPNELQNHPPIISVASFFGALKCVKCLLMRKASLEEVDDDGLGVLQFAITSRNYELIQELINAGADISFIGFYSLRKGYSDVFLKLYEMGYIIPNDQDFTKSTYLHLASLHGYTQIVVILLALDVIDVNAPDYEGRTALHLACGEGHLDVVQLLLLDKNIDLNPKDIFDRTPLYYAMSQGHQHIVEFLLGGDFKKFNEDGDNKLHKASRDGDHALVRCLTEIPWIDYSQPNIEGMTALHIASLNGHAMIVEHLISKIDPMILDHHGKTAIQYAIENSFQNIIDIFKSKIELPPTEKQI